MMRRLLAGLSLVGAACVHAGTTVPLADLVDDHIAVAVVINDAPALLRGWDGSPFAKTWNDPRAANFLTPLREKLRIGEWDEKVKEATGSTVRGLLAMADGEALLAMPAPDFAKLKKADVPPFLMAVHVGDHASEVEKIMAEASLKAGVDGQTEVLAGTTLHIRPLTAPKTDRPDAGAGTLAWAIIDGVWILGTEKERVSAAVSAFKNGGVDSSLGRNRHFLAIKERTGAAQALCYVNFASVYPLLKDVVASRAGAPGTPTPMGVDPGSALDALGLDALGEVYGAVFMGKKDARVDVGFTHAGERGLLKLMAFEPGPVPRPDWIPSGWPGVFTAKFSAGRAYAGLEDLLTAISPMMSGIVQGKIEDMNRKRGLDLKRDLIGSLGDEVVGAWAPSTGPVTDAPLPWNRMDRLLAVSLVNVDAFTQAVEALKQIAWGPAADRLFAKRDYLGESIYTFHARPGTGDVMSRGFSYAIANHTFLIGIGAPAMVENALQGMRDREGAFWKRDDVKTALAGMPSDAAWMQFADLRMVHASLFDMGERVGGNTGRTGAGDGEGAQPDTPAKPDAAVTSLPSGMVAGHTVKTADGIFSTVRIFYQQP